MCLGVWVGGRGIMLAKLFEPLLARAARSYQAMVGYELKKYGLRYDDLYDQLYSTVRRVFKFNM